MEIIFLYFIYPSLNGHRCCNDSGNSLVNDYGMKAGRTFPSGY
jgi:hypothetical protein